MSDRISYDVKVAAKAVLDALALPVTAVAVRKLPGFDEELDTLPLLVIANSEKGETNEPAGFATFGVSYFIDFVTVFASDHDRTAGLALEDEVRQKIRKAFDAPTLQGVPSVWNTRWVPSQPYDRERYNVNYDYSVITVEFLSQEP